MTTTKFYLNDIMDGHFFDTSDLNEDVWQLDDDGNFFTTDKEEAAWFENLANAYSRLKELEIVEPEYLNDYDDVISFAEGIFYKNVNTGQVLHENDYLEMVKREADNLGYAVEELLAQPDHDFEVIQ